MLSSVDLGRVRFIHIICLFSVILFFLLIFLPPVYVLGYGSSDSFNLDASSKAALINSFLIAATVTLVDIVIGLPVAWVMARRKHMRFRHLFDTLLDMPLVVPTSVLGLSVFYCTD